MIPRLNFLGMLKSSNNNETSVDTSSEWEEEAFLGSAVGILVTVILAAIAAVTMVLVRNQRQKRNLEEFGNFSTCSSIKSALEKENHPDVIPWEKRSQRDADSFIINMGGNIYANNCKNFMLNSYLHLNLRLVNI